MKKEFIKNTLIIGVGRVFTQFMSLILLPIYTLFLSPAEYGVGDLVITYAALALPLVTLSLEQGAFRLLIDARDDNAKKTSIITYVLRQVVLLGAALGVVASVVGMWYGFSHIGLAVAYTVAAVLLNVLMWFARGLGDSVNYSKAGVVTGSISLLSTIVLVAALHMGLTGMLLGLLLGSLGGALYLAVSLKIFRHVDIRIHDKVVGKDLLSYSLPLVPNSISWWLVNAADRTIIVIFLGAAATGLYAVSVKFAAILIGLFSIFWISWHESASKYIEHKDRDVFFSKITNTSLILFTTLALSIMAVVSVLFPYIVGKEFAEAYLYIPLLLVGALCNSLVTLYGSIYAAKKKTRQILNTTLLAAAINVAVMVALIQFLGLFAAALASVVAYLAMAVYRYFDVKKFVAIRMDWIRLAMLLPINCVVTVL